MIRGRSAVKAEEQIALVRRLVLCADQIAAVLLHVPRDDDVLPGVVAGLRTPVNNIEHFPPNFEGLVLGCIDADFCK